MSEDAFLAAIGDAEGDDLPRLAYADWLEERNDPRAEYLRLECEFLTLPASDERSTRLGQRLQELDRTLDPEWLALVRRLPGDPLTELRRILPPPRRLLHAAGDQGVIESALGLRLPSDYKRFISTYGSGTIGALEFVSPFRAGEDVRRWWTRWASLDENLKEFVEVPYPIFPQEGGLLPFGNLSDANLLGWLTSGDPDRWPFVYHDLHHGFIQVGGLSAVEFVLEAVTQRSPLLIRLGRESSFDPPCDFEAHQADPRSINFIHPREIDLDALVDRLVSRWPQEDLFLRRGSSSVRLRVESLGGWIGFGHDGDGRTWGGIHYDLSSPQAEEVARELLGDGFAETWRS